MCVVHWKSWSSSVEPNISYRIIFFSVWLRNSICAKLISTISHTKLWKQRKIRLELARLSMFAFLFSLCIIHQTYSEQTVGGPCCITASSPDEYNDVQSPLPPLSRSLWCILGIDLCQTVVCRVFGITLDAVTYASVCYLLPARVLLCADCSQSLASHQSPAGKTLPHSLPLAVFVEIF